MTFIEATPESLNTGRGMGGSNARSARDRLSEEGVDGLKQLFKTIDRDKSHTLDAEELNSFADNVSLRQEAAKVAARVLAKNIEDASNVASDDNELKLSTGEARSAFDKNFGSDKRKDGVSEKDIEAMRLVLSHDRTQEHLSNVRKNEKIVGAVSVGSGLFQIAAGTFAALTPSGAGQLVGIPAVASGAVFTYKGYNDLFNSGVPAYSEYIQQTRVRITNW